MRTPASTGRTSRRMVRSNESKDKPLYMISVAAECASQADVFVIIGTSLNVYPAAGLYHYVRPDIPVYLIDPEPVPASLPNLTHLQMGASEGMRKLCQLLKE